MSHELNDIWFRTSQMQFSEHNNILRSPNPALRPSTRRAVAESGSIPTAFVSQTKGHHSQGQPTHHGPSRVIYLAKKSLIPVPECKPDEPGY